MSRRETFGKTGLWLTCGGLLILTVHHLLTVHDAELSVDYLPLHAGVIAGYLAIMAGICLCFGYRLPVSSNGLDFGSDTPPVLPSESCATVQPDAHRQLAEAFLAWCEEDLPAANLWGAFDQLVRELLTEQLGAVRVRCYHVLPGCQQLRGLAQRGEQDAGTCARTGILGHVATTGREFFAGDPEHGELVDRLADDGDQSWEWICPILQSGRTVGLVALGKLPPTASLNRKTRQTLGALLTAFWRYAALLERLRIAERTDKASGLLTRGDFFECATRALSDSYAENEPVVVVALALEGLRRLDDVGRWSDRDKLVESIGRLVKRRIRTDDIIGRFSDDRFVLLLRRLDSGLGRLIAEKIQHTAQQQLERVEHVGGSLAVRVGVIGSGFAKPSLEALLVSVFDAVELARNKGLVLHCDLGPAAQENQSHED